VLLAVSEAIVAHRELPSLFRDLAGRLQQFVRYDYIVLVLHEAATNTMRLHLAAFRREPAPPTPEIVLGVDDDPAGLVWQTQQPLIIASASELERWPKLLERVKPYGVQSLCWLPLTTARRRLGALVFSCQQPSAYDVADVGFLQHVANQVAVAVENALAFQELTALKDRLAQEKAYLEEEISTENFKGMVAVSAALRGALKKVETVAPTDSTVLICGETGTGKERVARALHELSPRRERTFVKLNCAAIPTGLLESELFGHEKGAFTGAICQKVGRFELAHKGTIFLDEVGDIPLELQPKLLRVLQEQEFERLGSTKTIKVDVRLVAATNRDLARMVAEGRFRNDLYYRLNVFPIELPPLREQPDGIPSLVRHFTQQFARRMGKRIEAVPAATMEALFRYPWPGNVRELQNVIERAVILSPGPTLQVPLADLKPVGQQAPVAAVTLADAEREHILGALREAGGVLGGPEGAAARLGMKRSTLYKKMKKLDISRPE
jgi:formate hydrogenlyase transcriptional activator